MRTVVAICLIALFATSAVASHSKSKAANKAFSQELESALSMKQGLKLLVEMAEDDEAREVRRVLQGVRDEVAGTLNNVQERLANEESNYEDVRDQYVSKLKELEINLEQTRVALQYANDEVDRLTETIAASQSAIADAEAQKDAEEARRVATHEAFRAQYEKLQEAEEAVEDALKWIIEIDNEDLEDAFLEVNNKKILKNAKKINHIVNNVGISSHMTTFAQTFLEVASEGINQDLVDKLTTLLVALGEQIDAATDDAVARDNADDAYSRAVLGNLESTIDVENSAIEDNTSLLDNVLENVERLEGDEQTWAEYLEDTAEHYEAFQGQWEERERNLRRLIHRLEDDIVALDAADNFLDS